MTTQARDQNENVNPSKADDGEADGEDNACDRSDTRVEDRIQKTRDNVFNRVDDRRQSRWLHAATGQNGDEADGDADAEILNER